MRSGLILAIALAAPATAYARDVVIFEQSSTTNFASAFSFLPGAGDYKFEVTGTVPPSTFNLLTAYTYHWDVFVAPPPRPHHEYIDGNDYDQTFVLDFSSGVAFFTVPKTTYYFFTAGNQYEAYGVAAGTLVYQEDKYEDPYFNLYAESSNGDAFDYSFKVTHLNALPEPGTWALMIMGFGAAGARLRHRKAKHA